MLKTLFGKRLLIRLAATEAALAAARTELDEIQSRAVLTSIERHDRLIRFVFLRNSNPYIIETYGTISDNVPEWNRALLEPLV